MGGIGDTLKINPYDAEGSGVSSGKTIDVSANAGVSGIQLFKSFPQVAFVSNGVTNPNGTDKVLKQFTITANAAGPVAIDQLAFSVATTSAAVTNLKLYAYTDSGYSQGVSSQSSGTGEVGSPVTSFNSATRGLPGRHVSDRNPSWIDLLLLASWHGSPGLEREQLDGQRDPGW